MCRSMLSIFSSKDAISSRPKIPRGRRPTVVRAGIDRLRTLRDKEAIRHRRVRIWLLEGTVRR